MAMWSGDRPFYRGPRQGKEERDRKRDSQTKEERDKHTRRRTHRQMDRQTQEVRVWPHVLHGKTVKEVAEKVTEALL